MRTFRKVKAFGTTSAGATGGRTNEGILLVCGGAATTVTVYSYDTTGSTSPVGPISLVANQSFIYPITAYGWTAGNTVTGYELF